MEVSNMDANNKNLIDEVRNVIRVTEKSNSNTESNILKITNHRTKISKTELKILLDKYTGKYWDIKHSEGGNTAIYTNRPFIDFLGEGDNMKASNIKVINKMFIEEIRRAISANEYGSNNNKMNILEKVNQRTGIPITNLEKLYDEYTTINWTVEDVPQKRQ
jgi:hypothetical protein